MAEAAFQKNSDGSLKARRRSVMRMLYENFLSSKEDWSRSSIVANFKNKNMNKKIGSYRWRKVSELAEEHGEPIAHEMKDCLEFPKARDTALNMR